MSKRILLTGAGGAIGCHVLAHLLEKTDWDIVCTDSFRHKGYFDRIIQVTPRFLADRVKIIVHDLNAPFTKREIVNMGMIDYIINLASLSDVKESIEDPVTTIKNNTDLMLNMLEYARVIKPEVFIQFSTDEIYGPTPKNSGGHKEWDPILPSNPYAASKAAQEAICISYWRSYGIPLIITNTMNNFGAMQSPSKFPAMIQSNIQKNETITIHAGGNGEIGTRYYIHSRNTADAIVFILNNVPPLAHTPGFIDRPVRLNIVGDKQLSNTELVEVIENLMNAEAVVTLKNFHDDNPGHDLHYGLNGENLAKLGWKSPVSFEDSMKHTIEWQKEHPEWL